MKTQNNKFAAVQMASSPNVGANLIEAGRHIEDAARVGAGLVVLPENFALMGESESDKLTHREAEGSGPIQEFLAKTARQFSIWIVGGTVPVSSSSATKVRATCPIYNDQGEKVAQYDKIHLFDVSVPGSDEQYNESNTIEAGQDPLVIATPFGRLGIAVCYDLRFPELFRKMLNAGMEILAVPSAFTAATGAAHWELLVRARAVENLCYVIAANQGGFHLNGRKTYGDSMIVDPWGKILTRLPSGAGIACANVDHDHLEKLRLAFPALQHRRFLCGEVPSVC